MKHANIVQVALAVPLYRTFDYLWQLPEVPHIGGRVKVPFGRQTLVGIVVAQLDQSQWPVEQLKPVLEVIDQQAIWPDKLRALIEWCSAYYQYPLGDSYAQALPTALRKGKPACKSQMKVWQLTPAGKKIDTSVATRAVRQHQVLKLLSDGPRSHSDLLAQGINATIIKRLQEKQWICEPAISITEQTADNQTSRKQKVAEPQIANSTDKPFLNAEQAIAVASINHGEGFNCYLLDGVTGSGKTEVYLNTIEPVLLRQQQVLVLVPEIGLTPQTIARFKNRFQVNVALIHSGLNETEKLNAWLAAKENQAGIIIGTRSALFTPFRALGLIIVDEEHDASYKQQDTLRYHARDLAVKRAHQENIAIILGSATPSLESLQNALQGRYHHLQLTQRAGQASLPKYEVVDIKGLYLSGGLSAPLIAKMRQHLAAGNQVMLFLNRRGYAPAILCHECGWIAECHRCDAYYTFHQGSQQGQGSMQCHHCGSQKRVYSQCQGCGSTQLVTAGVGTEQLENELMQHFPQQAVVRIDRDSTRRKGSFEQALTAIHNNQYQILLGTQMLAKGHHFPNVTLVGLVDIDAALYSSDFRAAERLAQLLIQVSGRAGRASKPGTVILQTHHADHPLLQALKGGDYRQFAQLALQERREAYLPPFGFLTLFRAQANRSDYVEQFLLKLKSALQQLPEIQGDDNGETELLGPMVAPRAKQAGKFRWQLLLSTRLRTQMQQLMQAILPQILQWPETSKVRWSIDRDPQDLS